MSRSTEIKDYFRVLTDNRDLNYDNFFDRGEKKISFSDDYNSHNTRQLNVDEVKKMLLKLDFIKNEINV